MAIGVEFEVTSTSRDYKPRSPGKLEPPAGPRSATAVDRYTAKKAQATPKPIRPADQAKITALANDIESFRAAVKKSTEAGKISLPDTDEIRFRTSVRSAIAGSEAIIDFLGELARAQSDQSIAAPRPDQMQRAWTYGSQLQARLREQREIMLKIASLAEERGDLRGLKIHEYAHIAAQSMKAMEVNYEDGRQLQHSLVAIKGLVLLPSTPSEGLTRLDQALGLANQFVPNLAKLLADPVVRSAALDAEPSIQKLRDQAQETSVFSKVLIAGFVKAVSLRFRADELTAVVKMVREDRGVVDMERVRVLAAISAGMIEKIPHIKTLEDAEVFDRDVRAIIGELHTLTKAAAADKGRILRALTPTP